MANNISDDFTQFFVNLQRIIAVNPSNQIGAFADIHVVFLTPFYPFVVSINSFHLVLSSHINVLLKSTIFKKAIFSIYYTQCEILSISFIHIDKERALKSLAEERLRNPPPDSAIARARDFGIDLTLLIERLQLTPEERVSRLQQEMMAFDQIRGKGKK